ncbi:MAG: ABC transporter permease, partial [Aggregatilineales bacterium]
GLLEGLDKYMTISAGTWPPKPADLVNLKPGDPLPVAAPETMLNNMGVQVGNVLQMTPAGGTPIKVKVAALWRATNTNALIWNFYPPKAFDAVLLMPSDLLWQTIGQMKQPVEEAAWYLTFDGHNVRTEDIDGLLGRINNGTTAVYQALPGIRVEISPVDGLNQFNAAAQQLTLELAIIVLPVGGLVLYFVSLIAGLLVGRQNQEDVTLGSRGLGRRGILGVHATMWLILAGIAFALGMVLSPPLVNLVGRTTSFLRFDNPAGALTAVFTQTAIEAGIVTALLAASSGLYAAWRATRNSITSYKIEAARARPAWWQRIYLDFLLLIPAYYVLYTLEAKHGAANSGVTDPFADPLTFLGPTLFTLGHTLLFLRLWPIFMRIGANILARGRAIASLMALRELTRSIGRYRGSLLMMAFTLSLAGFTASMAGTLDSHLRDQISYSVGADAVIVTSADAQTTSGAPDATTGQTTSTVTGYNVLPVDDLRTIPGVAAVSRVGRYDMQLMLPKGPLKGKAFGIDRDTMAEVTRYRADYSSQPLADLFNRLAANPTGIIISQKMAVDNNLRINQTVNYQLYVFNQWREQDQALIVGIVNYFPTVDPRTTPFIITTLDPIFDLATTYLQYDVWMALKPGADPNAILQKVQELGFPVVTWQDADQQIFAAETAPDRRGILGFLSVGFVASILLTLVGNIVQSASSFQAQSYQLGSLRAMGLGGGAVGWYLILSQGLAVLSGIAGGTVIGAVTTLLFLPLLDFGGGLPPYLVNISWSDLADVYAVFAGVLLFVTLVMTFLLGRERLSNVVKLGDAT